MRNFIIMSLITTLMGIFSCKAQTASYESVSVEAFDKVIADTTVVRLDVRTAEEFAGGHIENAINIDVLQDDFEHMALATLPKGKTIAVNCRSGKRSKKAADILVKDGFRVIELDSGYNGWVAAGKKVVK